MIRSVRVLMLLLPLLLIAAGDAGPHFDVDPDTPPADWVLRQSPVLSPEQSLATIDLPPGYRAELVAAEPLVNDPISLAFGPDGRLWVIELPSYNVKMRPALGLDEADHPGDRIVVLEDTTGDGRFDERTVFLDGLKGPRTISPVADGVLVAKPPNAWFYRDTTGDGKADDRQVILDDYGPRANPHIMPNGLLWAMDNWIYSARYTARIRWANGDWQRDEPVVSRGQWGITQDNWGRLYYNTQADPLRADRLRPAYWRRNPNFPEHAGIDVRLAHDLSVRPHGPTPGVQPVHLDEEARLFRFTSSGAPAIYRGDHFPADVVGDAFVCVPTANFIRRFVITGDTHDAEARNAYDDHEFLFSHDERFRPVNAYSGPDGALYVVDMYRGIIEGHPWLEDSMADYIKARNLHEPFTGLGRIYRIVHEDHPLGDWPDLADQGPAQWVEHLGHPNGWWRDTAQRLLVERGDADVVPALRQLAADTAVEPHVRLHALWTLEGTGALDAPTILQALADGSPHVRETALHLAEPFLDDADVLAAVLTRADDEHRDVRRQLLFTLGEADDAEAEPAMRRILAGDADGPWMAEAALSSLHDRELSFLEATLDDPDWQNPPAGGDRVVTLLAQAVTNEGDPDRLARLAKRVTSEGWWQAPILAGIDAGRTANLARSPDAVRHLLDLPHPELRDRATALVATIETETPQAGRVDVDTLDESVRLLYEQGRAGYLLCAACHQQDGQGLANVAPALADSPWLHREPEGLIRITLHGLTGREDYPPMGPLSGLDDQQLAAILTYLRLTFSEEAGVVVPEDVQQVRQQHPDRLTPWTPEALEDAR